MLKLVDQIRDQIKPEPLAQLAEIAGEVKIAVRNYLGLRECPRKASLAFVEKAEGEILDRIRAVGDNSKNGVERALLDYHGYQGSFTAGLQAGQSIHELLAMESMPTSLYNSDGLFPHAILFALLDASRSELKQITGKAVNGNNAHHQETADNLLRLGQLLPGISYGDLYDRNAYKFMDETEPNAFAKNVVAYRNGTRNIESIVNGKTIVVLGSGNGRDDLHFLKHGASRVIAVDSSAQALKKIRDHLKGSEIAERKKNRLVIPETPTSMIEVLQKMADNSQKVDTIYSCSTLHYDGDAKFKKMMRLARNCLTEGGHLVFAIKLPGAAFDGAADGIKLFEDTSSPEEGDRRSVPRVYERAWLNRDGQIRFFRDMEAIKQLVEESNEAGQPSTTRLRLVQATYQEVEEYDVPGQRQCFGQFFYKKITA